MGSALRKPWGRTLGGDNWSAAGRGEGNLGGSDGRKYLPPKIRKQKLIAIVYYFYIAG